MAWRTEVSPDAGRDFELIFDRLLEAYLGFGEPVSAVFERAVFWLKLEESGATVRILAGIIGGQDHMRHMLARLLDRPG